MNADLRSYYEAEALSQPESTLRVTPIPRKKHRAARTALLLAATVTLFAVTALAVSPELRESLFRVFVNTTLYDYATGEEIPTERTEPQFSEELAALVGSYSDETQHFVTGEDPSGAYLLRAAASTGGSVAFSDREELVRAAALYGFPVPAESTLPGLRVVCSLAYAPDMDNPLRSWEEQGFLLKEYAYDETRFRNVLYHIYDESGNLVLDIHIGYAGNAWSYESTDVQAYTLEGWDSALGGTAVESGENWLSMGKKAEGASPDGDYLSCRLSGTVLSPEELVAVAEGMEFFN